MNDKSPSAFSKLRSRLSGLMELAWPYKALVGVAAIGIAIALLPDSLFQSFNCVVRGAPQNYQASNGYFIDNQVIIIGPENEVEAVIGQLTPAPPITLLPAGTPVALVTPVPTQTATVPVETQTPAAPVTTEGPGTPVVTPVAPAQVVNLIEGCDLGYLNTRYAPDSTAPAGNRDVVMRLYEVIDVNADAQSVINQINAIAIGTEPSQPTYDVLADPNFLTSLSDASSDPCGRPVGDPGSGGGKPYGPPGLYDNTLNPTAFTTQWAFGSQGINLPSSLGVTGRGVRVGVFDTSPYRLRHRFFQRVGIALPSPLWLKTGDATAATMVSNHGLFVAGLIHGVAPRSQIELIRVLNDNGCGEIWALNKALEDYTSRKSAWPGNLNKTVINMSLGIRMPSASNPYDLKTLKKVISHADDLGAIIFAAAGNDGRGSTSPTILMQVPAAYKNVIGVAATNKSGKLSCYSDWGDVAAPGGDGEPGLNEDGTRNPCLPKAATWKSGLTPCNARNINDCGYGLISLAQTRYGPQYVLWSGTSFATPLVSGLAALSYQGMAKKDVLCLIERGSSRTGRTSPDPLGWGIISFQNSLASTAVLSNCGIGP